MSGVATNDSLDTTGVNVTSEDLKELLSVDTNGWKEAVPADPRALRSIWRDAPGNPQIVTRSTRKRTELVVDIHHGLTD